MSYAAAINAAGRATVVAVILLSGLVSCNSQAPTPQYTDKEIKSILLQMNRADAQLESRDIDLFIKDKGWSMNTSGTGLRYNIDEPGTGDSIATGDRVTFDYEVSLGDTLICYSSEKDGPMSIVVGESDAVPGLHEALTYFRQGDKVKLVMPSHLAYGLTGDQDKIPSKAYLVYKIQVLRVLKKQ